MKTRAWVCSCAVLSLVAAATAVEQAPKGPVSAPVADARTLASHVTIRRDTFGVPHVLADSEEAASFGLGYAQAEDHCPELIRRYLAARGEEAKYYGEGLSGARAAAVTVDNDFRMKRYRVHEVAAGHMADFSPLFRRVLESFTAGVNFYVEQHRRELPAWTPTFTPVDVLAHMRAEIIRFALNDQVSPLQRKYPGGIAFTTPEPERGAGIGSNMWALAGSRTTSGRPILLGNPHQPWAQFFWEAQVTVPGKIDFAGATFVGDAALALGFNQALGWTHTVNGPDLNDVYALKLDPGQKDHYLFNGRSMPLTRRDVAVEVKDKPAVRRVYWDSHLGPIVYRTSTHAFALQSAVLDAYRMFEQWYAMSKARSFAEFSSILQTNSIPTYNIGYADAEGHILYLWNGTVPKRLDDGTSYGLDVPGDTDKYVWHGFHPTADLPQLLDPSGGYIQNCNDAPWSVSLRNPLDPHRYPSYFDTPQSLSLRAQMSLEMLEGRTRFSLDDVIASKFNTKLLLADRVKPALVKAAQQTSNPSADLQSGLTLLEAWDNHASAESRGSVVFQRFWELYTRTQGRLAPTGLDSYFARHWDPKDPAHTPSGIADPARAVQSLEEAVRWTRTTFGSEAVTWGETHRLRAGALDLPGDGGLGELGAFRVMEYQPAPDGKLVAGYIDDRTPPLGRGDTYIFAVQFSKPAVAYSLLAYGETANLASAHSGDQLRLFASHHLKPVWFTDAEIRAHLERAYHPGQ
jgi:acyl-homoserine-lactone acylase